MPKFFYTDCSITNLQRVDTKDNVFTALINGRKCERLVMDSEIYHYLLGPGKNTKSRIWFYDPGFRRPLTIVFAGGIAGTGFVARNLSLDTTYKLVTRPIVAGILAWFATWILLVIPVLGLYGASASQGIDLIETLAVGIGCATGAAFLASALWVVKRATKFGQWLPGDIMRYTKERTPTHKPGSGQAVKPTRSSPKSELVD